MATDMGIVDEGKPELAGPISLDAFRRGREIAG
jgi:hypothetical protein